MTTAPHARRSSPLLGLAASLALLVCAAATVAAGYAAALGPLVA